MRKSLFLIVTLLLVATVVLPACGPTPTPEKIIVKETVPVTVKETLFVPVTATPPPPPPT